MGREDDDKPTPRSPTTGTWEVYKDRCRSYATRLRFAATAKMAPGSASNPRLYDPQGAGRMFERAELLDWMAEQFSLWPCDPEKWAVERLTLGPLFVGLSRKCEEDFLRMPRRSDGGAW